MSEEQPTSNEHIEDVQYACFLVDEHAYCLWDVDVKSMTLEFLNSVDPTYFEYVGNAYFSEEEEDKKLLASLALRTYYSQSLETLFSFIAATLQAPYCVPAWITTCMPRNLESIVNKISLEKSLPTVLKNDKLSWHMVSEFIHTSLVLDDKEKEEKIKKEFADLWANLALDFLDDGFKREYNSIKHGLRIRPGGFFMKFGGFSGQSDYGSSFLVKEKLLNHKHHFRLVKHHRNWDPEDLTWGLHLASMSIQNVISALKILNNVPPENVKFLWPTEEENFQKPWKNSKKIGARSMTIHHQLVPDELAKPFTRDEIKTMYMNEERINRIRYRFADEAQDED